MFCAICQVLIILAQLFLFLMIFLKNNILSETGEAKDTLCLVNMKRMPLLDYRAMLQFLAHPIRSEKNKKI